MADYWNAAGSHWPDPQTTPQTSPPFFVEHHDPSRPQEKMYWNAVYYPNWRIYRDQPPVSLNFDVLSHVFYAFAW